DPAQVAVRDFTHQPVARAAALRVVTDEPRAIRELDDGAYFVETGNLGVEPNARHAAQVGEACLVAQGKGARGRAQARPHVDRIAFVAGLAGHLQLPGRHVLLQLER